MNLVGDVEIIRFRNDENGYSVVILDVDGEPVTAAGTFPPLKEGMRLKVSGEYTVHPKFGRQFSVSGASAVMPSSEDGMIRYLGSGIIKGVGPKTAMAIVSKFGNKTFDVIENLPLKLAEIKGITRKKAAEIGEEFCKIKNMNDAMMFMQSHGITLNAAFKIYETYGDKTVAAITSNPYKLIEDVDGIGFVRADAIAKNLGFEQSGEPRLRAGLLHTLKESCDKNGNTFLPLEELTEAALRLLQVGDEDSLADIVDGLVIDGFLKKKTVGDTENAVMPRRAYRAEKGAAVGLTRLMSGTNAIVESVEDDIKAFEKINKVTLAERQRDAVRLAARSGVCVITGGPGTGKTTIVKCILGIFERRKEKVMLMAPTGRAAKRLSESTGREASTIHRALNVGNEDDERQPLNADVVIVDEVSMMDIYLTDMLLKRLRPEAKIIFVGDKDQLPSVGSGNVLSDMLKSGEIPSVTLDAIFRQDTQSLIVVNAHRINAGQMPDLTVKDRDFFFAPCPDPIRAADTVVEMASRRLPKFLNCEPYKVQVLCPVKNGACGTVALNGKLRRAMNGNADRKSLQDENAVWCVGDKVMHVANNYRLEWKNYSDGYEEGKGVFNGDLGIITDVRGDSGEIDVKFEDGREATYNSELRGQLVPAYAITVHKSQGSEFDAVIIPVVGGGPMIMTRNLLYTAITRAKKAVVIVGSDYWVKRMVENNYIQKRYSALKDFIAEAVADGNLLRSLGTGD